MCNSMTNLNNVLDMQWMPNKLNEMKAQLFLKRHVHGVYNEVNHFSLQCHVGLLLIFN